MTTIIVVQFIIIALLIRSRIITSREFDIYVKEVSEKIKRVSKINV